MKDKIKISTIFSELILLLATIICWVPLYYFIIGAFKTRTNIVKFPLVITPKMFTFSNFPSALKLMHFFQALGNTGIITVVAMFFVIIFASLAGFVISRVKRKFFTVYYSVLVALMVVPFIGCLIPLIVLSTSMNLTNTLLGCIFIQIAWNLPFATFLYVGFMQTLPKELEEAAYIDGCSMFQVYLRIFLPLLTPCTATCCIRCGIGIWNDYLVSSALLNAATKPTLMIGVQAFFGQYQTDYGYAFAGIIAASLPMTVLFICLQKYFIKGLAAGAVKG